MNQCESVPSSIMGKMRLPVTIILVSMLLFSNFIFLPDESVIVSAQPVPEYRDASNGLPTADLWVSKLRFFDIDEDGDRDLFSLGPRKGDGEKTLSVWKWTGSAWVKSNVEEGTGQIPHSSYGGFSFSDFDNDGDWDVGVGSHGADDVEAYTRVAQATYLETSTGLDTAEDAWDIDFGDFNSDGNMDMLETGFWGMDSRVFAGSGYGTWLEQSTGLPSGHTAVEGHFFDANNDGNLDIVASWGHEGWVYLGDGNGMWTNASQGLPYTWVGDAVNWGDFNNDGYADIILTYDGATEAYIGDGTGNWTEISAGLPDIQYSSVALADLNDDKFDDLVAMQSTDPGLVEVYLYSGANSWVKDSTTAMQGNAKGYRVNVGDFDNNGFNDIVAGFGTDDMASSGSIRVWQETTEATELGITLTYPDGMEVFNEGSVWFIEWLSSVPLATGPVDVTLEYSTTGDMGPWITIVENSPNSGVYQWAVPEGMSDDAFIRITISDGMGTSASDTNDNAFGIGINPNINHSPQITILSPSEENETVDKDYFIEWNATDSDEDQLSTDLYYDDDTDPDNGNHLIAEDLQAEGNASFDWNTTDVDEGIFYIYGWVEDEHGKNASGYSRGTVNISHDPGGGGDPDPHENQPPTMEVTQPDGIDDDDVDEEYTIRWSSNDQDQDTITIDLYYDDNDNSEDGKTLIDAGISNSGSYLWNTSEIDEGEYYILGIADDNNGSRVEDYSDGTLMISHPDPPPPPPPDENEEPSIEVTIDELDEFTTIITWDATDPDEDELTIDLYYDIDTDPDNGQTSIANELENTGEHHWDIFDIEEGEYYICAVVNDGNGGEGTDHSDEFTIDHPDPVADFEITFFQAASASDKPGENVFIQAKVRNVGDGPGVGTLVFSVDNVSIQTVDLQLDPGEEKSHHSLWITVEGNHTISVEAVLEGDPTPENNWDSRMLFIVGSGDEKKDDDDDITAYLVAGGILVLVVLTGGILFISSRRKEGTGVPCPTCGRKTEHSHDEDDDYCWNCEEYVGEMPRR